MSGSQTQPGSDPAKTPNDVKTILAAVARAAAGLEALLDLEEPRIGFHQWAILQHLATEGDTTPGALARRLGQPPHLLRTRCQGLEHWRLIRQVPAPAGKSGQFFSLTAFGQTLLETLEPAMQALADHLTKATPQLRIAPLTKLLAETAIGFNAEAEALDPGNR